MLKLRVKLVRYESNINNNIKRPKLQDISPARDLKNLCFLPETSVEGLGSRREHCWSYVVSVFENTL